MLNVSDPRIDCIRHALIEVPSARRRHYLNACLARLRDSRVVAEDHGAAMQSFVFVVLDHAIL